MVIAMFRTTRQMPAPPARTRSRRALQLARLAVVMDKCRYPGMPQRVGPDGDRMSA